KSRGPGNNRICGRIFMYTDGRTYADGRMLIGGQMVESRDGGWLETTNPADETPLGRVPLGSAADMKAAIDAAEKAQPAWANLSMAERSSYIKKLGDALMKRADEIAKIETLDTGNTIGPMRRDVTVAVDRMMFYCGIAYELKGDTIPGTPAPNLHFTLR